MLFIDLWATNSNACPGHTPHIAGTEVKFFRCWAEKSAGQHAHLRGEPFSCLCLTVALYPSSPPNRYLPLVGMRMSGAAISQANK